MTRIRTLLFILSLLLQAPVALAAGPGGGINFGKVTLSPAIQLNFLVDSNVARSSTAQLELVDSTNTETFDSTGSAGLELRPTAGVSYKSELLRLASTAGLAARVYFARPGNSYWNDVTLRASADFLPDRPFGISVRDNYSYKNYPDPSIDGDPSDWDLLSRGYNSLWAEGRYSPGSALDFNLAAIWQMDIQELTNLESALAPGKNEFGLQLKGKWRFFPRTLLLVQADYLFGTWSNLTDCIVEEGGQCIVTVAKSTNLNNISFQTGLAGQITNTIQANVFVGYGVLDNTDNDSDLWGLGGILAQLQVVYNPQPAHAVSFNFYRRYTDAALMDFIGLNGVSAGYTGTWFSKLQATLQASFDSRDYNSASTVESESRADWSLGASFGLEYRVAPWLSLTGSFKPTFTTASPNASFLSSNDATSFDSDKYTVNQAVFTFGVRGVY